MFYFLDIIDLITQLEQKTKLGIKLFMNNLGLELTNDAILVVTKEGLSFPR